jgi:pyruvate ferredoxin oxidoreductase gamma subunit
MDDKPIRVREPITEPDAVIVQDPTLVHQVDLFGGLEDSGYLLVNTSRALAELGLGEYVERFEAGRCATVPATEIARARLGRPLPNAALLGAFAELTGQISFDSVAAAIRERFSGPTGEQNVAAAEDAHEFIVRASVEALRA